MGILEIVLIILGIILIVISSLIIERPYRSSDNEIDNALYNSVDLYKDDLTQMKKKIDELITESSDDIINKTENQLSKVSNEKIMAVSEYSDQVLEKINKNHEEVVFLYQMLNDKEKELKTVVKELNSNQLNNQAVTHDIEETMNASSKNGQKAIFDQDTEDNINNHNVQIINEYKKGKSIVEISKSLGLGQGEVKLVVDLYCGTK